MKLSITFALPKKIKKPKNEPLLAYSPRVGIFYAHSVQLNT